LKNTVSCNIIVGNRQYTVIEMEHYNIFMHKSCQNEDKGQFSYKIPLYAQRINLPGGMTMRRGVKDENYAVCALILLIVISTAMPNRAQAEEKALGTEAATETGELDKVLKLVQEAKPVPENEFIYELSPDGKSVIIKGINKNFTEPAVLMYPASIEGMPVSDITFYYPYDRLLAIVVPEGIRKFRNVLVGNTDLIKNLVYISLPSTLFYEESWEFELSYAGYNNFENCRKLARVDMAPSYPSYIGKFSYCTSLTSFNIPANVKKINDFCFHSSGLKSIVIPEGVESIGYFAFNNCANLTSVTLPSTLETIGPGAFSDCNNLTEVIIPESLKKLNFSETAFRRTHLPLKTQARLRELGYKGEF